MTHLEKHRAGMCGIYQIKNTKTGVSFIGSSASINNKWSHEMKDLMEGGHANDILQASWNLDGPTFFEFSILEFVEDRYELPRFHLRWIEVSGAADVQGRSLDDLKNDLRIPSSHVSLDKSLKEDIRTIMPGTMRSNVRELIRFYKSQQPK